MPETPQPLEPTDAASIDTSSVTFEWTSVDAASNYELQIAPSPEFGDLLFEGRVGDLTAFTYSGLSPDAGALHWRVRAFADEAWSDFSEPAAFEVEDWSSDDEDEWRETVPAEQIDDGPASTEEGVETSVGPVLMVFTLAVTVAVIGVLIVLFNQNSGATSAVQTAPMDTTSIDRYDVVDEESGVYQIPIDSAMQKVIREQQARGDSL